MPWLVFIPLCFGTGLLRLPRWSVAIWPAASIGLGIYIDAIEALPTDQPGFGYFLGVAIAAVCLFAWLIGRVVSNLMLRGTSTTKK